MAIEGQLEDVGLADICQLLAMGRKTGCLTVTDRSSFGYIYFDGGRVVYANVLHRPDRLGELLVRNGVITRDDLSAAMEQQAREPGRRLGRILVDRGSLTEEELVHYITIQIAEAVYHLFAWERGSFHFDPDELPQEEGIVPVSINAESLLLEGARRVDEWSYIQKKLPSLDLIFALERDPRGEEGVELTPEQEKILPFLDGTRSVQELVVESGLVEFDTAKAVYGLLQAGFVQRVGERASGDGEGRGSGVGQHLTLGAAYERAGMLEDASREYQAALELDPRQGTARVRLALIALREGRPAEALDHFAGAPSEVRDAYPALRNRALALELLHRYEDALLLLDQAVEVRPGDLEAHLARGVVLFKDGKVGRAREAFRRVRALLPDGEPSPPLFYAFATLAAAADGDWEEALRLGREGITRYPEDGAVLVNLGALLEQRGENGAAEALYLRAVAGTPTPAQAHKNLGDMAYRRGDQAGARAHLERAVRLDSRLGDDVYLKLGNLAFKDDDRETAARFWRRALELNPRNEVARTNLETTGVSAGR
jgi:tetratricopeptide (TPR) repeat protein